MFLRAVSLARGHSGVRPLIVEKLIEMLNKGVTPCVPRHGSVGASGDLAPLSHIAMVLIEPSGGDEEFAWIPGVEGAIPAGEAMAAVGISRIKLEAKEGLAFNNGTTYSTALRFYRLCLGRGCLRRLRLPRPCRLRCFWGLTPLIVRTFMTCGLIQVPRLLRGG